MWWWLCVGGVSKFGVIVVVTYVMVMVVNEVMVVVNVAVVLCRWFCPGGVDDCGGDVRHGNGGECLW